MTPSRRVLGIIALAASAAVLLTLSNGKFSNPVAAWLAPFVLVRLMRDLPVRRALLVGYVVAWAACCIQWAGVFPLSGPLFLAAGAILCLVAYVPYFADRLLAPRLGGLRGTFVLPTAMVVAEFLFTRFAGYGSWGSIAYSQAPVLPLVQIAAVTGTYGVTFLLGWTASIANLLLEDRRARRSPVVLASALALAALAATLLHGAARLASPSSPPSAEPIRIATISPRTDDDANYMIRHAAATQDSAFARSRDAARAGASFIVWPEGASFILQADEPAWIERAREFAKEARVTFVAPYGVRVSVDDERYENKMVMIAPDGTLLWDYRKSRPVPGMEPLVIAGDGRIATADTPEGRIAGMICFDADHPDLLRQVAGRADLLFVPSDDWKNIVGLHAAMVRLRAIEYGVPIVRSTLHGLSAAYDRFGRVLGSLDDGGPTERVMIVDVVPGGVRTLYARFGDVFVMMCVLGFAALAITAGRNSR